MQRATEDYECKGDKRSYSNGHVEAMKKSENDEKCRF